MIPLYRSNKCIGQWLLVAIALIIIFVSLAEARIRLVSVLFRHGDRTPDKYNNEMYPTDPYLHYDFYPEGYGQLTMKGKRRAYDLGEFLRKRYNDFLGKTYVPHIVTALSSDLDRTKMTLQLVLAGLFPPTKNEKWKQTLNWQPIPTNYVRYNEDNQFLSFKGPEFIKEYEKVLSSREAVKSLEYYINSMKKLPLWTGKNFTQPKDFSYLYQTLYSERSLGLKLPGWTQEIFPKGQLYNATVFGFNIADSTPLLRKLNGGTYIRTVINITKDYKNGKSKNLSKIYLYSGHESNIVAAINALNINYPLIPEYSSALIIELHKINHQYYVKVVYYLGIPPNVQDLQIPGCKVLCPLDTFFKITANVIPSDRDLHRNKKKKDQVA